MAFNARDIEFLYEIGSLRNVQRGWRQHLGLDVANDLEHTIRVIWIAILLARREGVKDEDLVMKMALVHDLAETRTSDHSYVQKVYVKADEARAAADLFEGTSFRQTYLDILRQYERRDTIEAKIVKDADNLEAELELKELEERGSKLAGKWIAHRKIVRNEKLYTESARKLWDEIDRSDAADWHLASNKWLKVPDAGT